MVNPHTEMKFAKNRSQWQPSEKPGVTSYGRFQLRPVAPVDIFVDDLSIQVHAHRPFLARLSRQNKKTQPEAGSTDQKCILSKINVRISAGTVTAILGSSGSGKTSLLNALAQRGNDNRSLQSGRICYNGSSELSSVRSAYVMQQDFLTPTLTVREILGYAAQLRQPGETTLVDRKLIVEEAISELGLEHCADTRIGNAEHGGCSGGEKRRVSLGVQLLSNPSIVFLDEVTTGLDAAAAYQLVILLKQLARRGRTIIITIHQPRSEMWNCFDQIILLAEGSVVLSGDAGTCLSHCASVGYPIPPFVNPAEYLIDLAAVDFRSPQLEKATRDRLEQLTGAWREAYEAMELESVCPCSPDTNPSKRRRTVVSSQYSSFANRIKVQSSRTLKTSWRDPNGILGAMIECLVMAILTGWIFYSLDRSQSGIRSREGALYIAVVLQSYLVLLYETYRLTLEIAVFDCERAEGVVDAWSFLLSRRIAKFPIEDIPVPLIYSVIVYFMIGFQSESTQYLIFFGFILLTHYVSVVLAAVAVAIRRDFAGASLFVNMNLNLQALCSGFLLQTNQIPVYVEWTKWLAYAFYSIGGLVTNEFIGKSSSAIGQPYDCPLPGGTSNPACAPWTGRFVISSLGYPVNSWIWKPAVILIGFIGVFWISAGLILTFFQHEIRLAKSVRVRHDLSLVVGFSEAAKVSATAHRGLTVTLENISLEIEQKSVWGQVKARKSIIKPLNVAFRPGLLNVVIGVSGGGKSSLLKVIGKRLSNSPLNAYISSGSVRVGGLTVSDDIMRSLSSYVSQSDDCLIPTLTVREMIRFAAHLRLSSEMSAREKTQRAERVIWRLGLRGCADNLIGSETIKGISGGEKRRVSIAVHIVAEPRIILLDEPTSGLDAFTASSILDTLRGLAMEGTTVILTIHQARSDHFQHFGSVLLLAQGGFPVYFGAGEDMLSHFASLGCACPENMNPSDFALDLVGTRAETAGDNNTAQRLITAYAAQQTKSVNCATLLSPAHLNLQSLLATRRLRLPTLSTICTLLRRSIRSLSRDRSAIIARTTQVLGFTILTTLFYAPLRYNYSGVQSQIGLLQQLLAIYFIGMLQNVAIYPGEHAVFRSEHKDGLYGVEPFFISYSLMELPFDIANSILVGALTTFAVGLPRTGTVFGVITCVSFSLISCGESVGLIFNALFSSTGLAVSLISVILSLGLVMSGVLSTDLNGFLDGINHISPAKWAVAAMAPFIFRGQIFSCTEVETIEGQCPIEAGEDVLQLYRLGEDGGVALVWLFLLVLGYRLLAYLLLKIVQRELRLWRRHGEERRSEIGMC